jgi:hypothetical protein
MHMKIKLGLFIFIPFILSACLEASVLNEKSLDAESDTPRAIVWSSAARLKSVDDRFGNGFAEANYDGENYTLSMRVSLPPLTSGKYVGWLMKKDPPTAVLLGTMENINGPNSYSLKYSTITDLSDHDQVLITNEPKDDKDSLPGEHILEGMMKIAH